ncbi:MULTISPECIES: WG repeat-containing protein [unclassified Anabaena]|uniref:WG repeat-containing protein n=1 Tax=unclassified Anabaena TaxID=2619674 RepID=UPI0039C5D8A0
MSVLQKGYGSKTENLYPVQFYMAGKRSGYAYVNQAAQMVVEPQFDYANEFSEGFAPVRINKKWGFINLQGQIAIPPQYDTVGESRSLYGGDKDYFSSSFSEGLAGVKLNGKWGFIHQKGELVIPYRYDKVQRFSGGVATVKENGLWGVINSQGKWIIEPVDKSPIRFFQGITKLNYLISWDKSGQPIGNPNIYWDKSGQLVGNFYSPPQLAKEFQEGLAIIQILRKDLPPEVITSEYLSYSWTECGFQDKQGKVVIEPQFNGCKSFSQGLAAVRVVKKVGDKLDTKWGYINKTAKFAISPQFDYADSLVEELGLVVSHGKIGFIDKTGKVVIKPQFDPSSSLISSSESLKSQFKQYPDQLQPSEVMPYRFSNGLAAVGKDNKCGYIDKTGKFAIQPQFTRCEQFDQYGVAKVYQNDYDGFYITRDGKTFPQMITTANLSKFYPVRIKLLTSVMACLLWIVAISCHEFGHAIVAYWGGDSSVKDKGYLSFDPRRYINPIHSIILPGIFLVTGGLALPGAAVYIEFEQLRNRLWSSFTAAAGPIASIIFGLLLVPVFHVSLAWNFPHWFSAFIAVFINLQFIIALLNLLPIPPLDGYRILSVWLPSWLQDRSGIASLIGLLFICFILPFISITNLLFLLPFAITLRLGISEEFSLGGWNLLDRWYSGLPFLIAGIVYLVYQPAFIFRSAGFILESFFPELALKMYDKSIELDPKNAFAWERKALIIGRQNLEAIPIWEEAIKLNPYNRFSRRMLIIELRLSRIWSKPDGRLEAAIEEYIKSYPKDGWAWGVKALTLDEMGNDEEALLAWEKNIKFDPSDRNKWRTWTK